jgi:YidC/Oxa1 family membrane protein insertase
LRFKVIGPLIAVAIVIGAAFIFLTNETAEAAPPDTPGRVIERFVEKAGVSLEKQPGSELVPLGQVVSYTVTIQNDSERTIEATLVDELPKVPEGLALQTDTISSTTGTVEGEENTVFWAGSLAPGEGAVIVYDAVPPTTSTADQTQENVAVLQFGETTLEAAASITTQEPDLNLWNSFVNFIAMALVFFDRALASATGLTYTFGLAIILFTVVIRLATFPLNMQQIKSSKAMQELQPKLKALQEKHKGDKEKLAQEQMALYKEHGVNPLGGCLPMLVQMPIWFALYRSLIQLSTEGLLNEPFLWIPNLAGPVSGFGGGIEWLWPFPPSVGWPDALAYLVMPVLLVVSQLYMQKLMTPASSDPQQAQMQGIMKFMPLMFGYFALVVPSGLTLYWFTSNILGVGQHYITRTKTGQAPATATTAEAAVSASSAPVPATSTGTAPASVSSEEDKKDKKRKNVRSKRKSKRKR